MLPLGALPLSGWLPHPDTPPPLQGSQPLNGNLCILTSQRATLCVGSPSLHYSPGR